MKTLSKSKGVKEINNDYKGQPKWAEAFDKLGGRTWKETSKLMQQFLKENPMVIDDDSPAKFDEWLSNLESK